VKTQVPFGSLPVGARFQRWTLGGGRPWWVKLEPGELVYSHTEQRPIRINAEHCGPAGQYTAREIDDGEMVWVKEERECWRGLQEVH
jgi:hypothetical protein